MRLLAGDPRLREAGDYWRKRVREAGTELAADEALRAWLGGFRRLRELVGREVAFFERRDFKVPELEKLVAAYEGLLVDLGGQADLAVRAAYGRARAAKMLAIYSEQMRAREDPEYRALMEEYVKLQVKYGETNGDPGEQEMERLTQLGARLGELRHEASMGAFREAEAGSRAAVVPAPAGAKAAIETANRDGAPAAFSGIGF
jgi:hypothetical protein